MKKGTVFLLFLFITCGPGKSGDDSMGSFLENLLGGGAIAQATVGQTSDFNNVTPPNPDDVVIGGNTGSSPTLPINLDLSFVSAPGGGGTLIRSLKLEIDGAEYTNAQIFTFAEKEVASTERKIVKITNTGTDQLNLVRSEVISASHQFRFHNAFAYAGTNLVTLSPNQFVRFELEFSPTSSGNKTGTLKLVSDDPNIPEKLLEIRGIGANQANAVVMKPQNVVSRTDSIVIEFSHSMDRGSICPAAEPGNTFPGTNPYGGSRIRLSSNLTNPSMDITGYCYWNTFRQLIIDPLETLEPNTRYYIDLTDARLYNSTNGLYCVRRVDETCTGSTVTTSFVTEPAFQFTVSLQSGFPIHPTPAGKAAILDQNTITQVQVQTSVSEMLEADEIKLKKLSNPPTSASVNWSANMNLSTLADTNLRPTSGANTYYLEIKKGPKFFYRVFGFHYGRTANNPSDPIDATARINIGTGQNGITRLGKLLERLFQSNGNFTTSSDNFRIGGKNFSDPYPEFSGTTSNGCARIKVSNLTDIRVGHVIRGVSLPPNTYVTEIVASGSRATGDGCPNNTTFNNAPILRLSQGANNGFGASGTNLKMTAGPDVGKPANLSNGSNLITFADGSDLFPGVFVNHPNVPAGTTLLANTSGNTWTMTNTSSLTTSGTTVVIGRTFMQNPKRTGTVLTGTDALGQSCLSNPNDFRTARELSHLLSIGPFCRIAWSWGGFLASGRSDVYVTNMTIENTANGSPNNNLQALLTPAAGASNNGQLNINLNGKRLKGTLRLFMHSGGGLAGGLANGAVYEVDFIMSPNGGCSSGSEFLNYNPSANFNVATAMTSLNVPSTNGLLDLSVNNQPAWLNSPTATEFNVSGWNSAICAHNVRTIKPGTFDSIIQAVLESVIPGIQWRVVQGVIRDTLQTVTPNILNALFYQLRKDANTNGIDVELPDYLPSPFDKTKINLGVNLKQDTTNRVFSDGLDLTGSISVSACQKSSPSSTTCLDRNTLVEKPEVPHLGSGFTNSVLLFSNGTAPRSQLSRSTVNNNRGTSRISAADGSGVLLALHSDAINQALYQLWWNGILNLRLDQNFANKIKDFRGDSDRLFQIFQILLKADSILKVLAPGRNQIYFKDTNGNLKTVNSTDDIFFKVEPILPPNVKFANMSLASNISGNRSALLDLEWTDLILRIYGKQGGDEYLLTSLKLGISTRMALGARKFTSGVGCTGLNPNNCSGSENAYYQVSSIQLNLCDDNNEVDFTNAALSAENRRIDCDSMRIGFNDGNTNNDLDLFYTLEVLDSKANNPSGLNPDGIREVLDPTVQKLIIPVLNYVLEYIPLEKKNPSLSRDLGYTFPNYNYTIGGKEDPNASGNKLAANCGIRLNDLISLPYSVNYTENSISVAETTPYILLNIKLSDYTFWGNCTL